jgi:SAM-dependent methyltransferase
LASWKLRAGRCAARRNRLLGMHTMSNLSSTQTVRDQDNVWDYFQTEGASIFDYAVPRLNYLFHKAARLAADRRVRVLNIGIGNGWLEKRCQDQGWETVALDPTFSASKDMAGHGVNVVIGGIEALPFGEDSFDVVFCSEVLEHLTNDLLQRGLQEVCRVLKPNGSLLGTVPYEEPLELRRTVCPKCNHVHHAYGHHQSFTIKRMADLFLTKGLEPVDFKIRSFPGFHRRNLIGKMKSLVWVIVGRFGAQAADSKIVFAAKPS